MIKYGKNLSVVMITMNEQMSVEKVIKDIQGIDQRIEIVIYY